MKLPAKNPCGSCPYRLDTPSGVWDFEEYDKLPKFDDPTQVGEETIRVFLCHQQDGSICAGWAGVHQMDQLLGPRIALLRGSLTEDEYDALCDYTTPVPLHPSGAAAAEFGKREVLDPDTKARIVIDKLRRKENHERR